MRRTTVPSNNLYLVVGYGPNRPVLTVSEKSVPGSITITRNDYHIFRLYMLHIFRMITEGPLSGLQFGTPARIDDALKEVLYFLYADIVRLVAPKNSEHGQLEQTALALYSNNVTIPDDYYAIQRPIKEKPGAFTIVFDATAWNTPGRCFFDMSVAQRVAASPDHQELLRLTLNAVENLKGIEYIIKSAESARPLELPILLNQPSTTTITHLQQHFNIQRSGTPLQMALYGGDEAIVAYLKPIMDPKEFERQSKTVFRNALSTEIRETIDENASALEHYHAMLVVQKTEAKKLCNEAFQFCIVDGKPQFTITDATVADFQQKLTNYVKNNSVHNPFILHCLYEIYEKLPGFLGTDSLFLKKAIGHAQALSSARWLQHYAQGIRHLVDSGDGKTPESMKRSFISRNSNSPIDVHHLDSTDLGVNSFVSINGLAGCRAAARPLRGLIEARCCENLCQAKTTSFQNLLRSLCEHAPASRGA